MRIEFSDEFKVDKKTIGTSIVLSKYTIEDDDNMRSLTGLWKDGKFQFTVEDASIDIRTIRIYYTYLGMSELKLGITLNFLANEPFRDFNYIEVPIGEVDCNIFVNQIDQTINFLENPTAVLGVNMFKAEEVDILGDLPVTKTSYNRYISQESSKVVGKPMYFDEVGKKIVSTGLKKEYKTIKIWVAGNTYYVNSGTSVVLEGECTYDLVKDGEIVKKDLREGLQNSIIETGEGIIVEGDILTFEGDDITSSVIARIGNIKSNELVFEIYSDYGVDFSTNLIGEDGHPILLFDVDPGSQGWDPDSTFRIPSGEITIFSKKYLNPNNIEIKSDNESTFKKYFTVNIGSRVEYDEVSKRYTYKINIETKQSSKDSEKWFPLDDKGESIEICNTIQINNSKIGDINFHCIQRPGIVLDIQKVSDGTSVNQVTFNTGYGFLESTDLKVVGGDIEDYTMWEAIPNFSIPVFTDRQEGTFGNTFKVYTRRTGLLSVSSIIFKRINSKTKGYNPTWWKDLIYCHPSLDKNLVVLTSGTINPEVLTKYTYEDSPLLILEVGKKHLINLPNPVCNNSIVTVTSDGITIRSEDDGETPIPVTYDGGKLYVTSKVTDPIEFKDTEGNTIDHLRLSEGVSEKITLQGSPGNWFLLDKDTEVDINQIGGSIPSGEVNLVTETSYKDYKFDPLQVRRVAGGEYNSLIDVYKDWRNQKYEDTIAELPMSTIQEYDRPEDLEVMVVTRDGEVQPIDVLELDYLGLYRLKIKSSSNFRISLGGGNNKNDGFYFYDTYNNEGKYDTLMQEEHHFNPFFGTEICFVYYGGEPGAFQLDEQTLTTYIRVESMESGKYVQIPLHRAYTNLKSPLNVLTGPDTKGNIFLTEDTTKVTYFSTIDTGISINRVNKGSMNIDTLYDTYFTDRGYIMNEISLDFSGVNNPTNSYPIEPISKLSIYQRNSEATKEMEFYRLFNPSPIAYIRLDGESAVKLKYKKGSTKDITVSTTLGADHFLEVFPEGGSKWIRVDSSYKDNLVSITKNGNKYTFKDETGYDLLNGNQINICSIRVTSYVAANKFLVGKNIYTQDEVNSLVVPVISDSVNVVKMNKNETIPTISGSTSIVNKKGEYATYILNIKDDKLKIQESLNKSPGVSNIELEGDNLYVTYKSRLNGNSERFSLIYTDAGLPTCQSKLVELANIRKVPLTLVFESGEEIVVNRDQEGWTTGLRFFQTGNPVLVLGNDVNPISFEINYNTTRTNFTAVGVNLPLTMESGFTSMKVPGVMVKGTALGISVIGELSYKTNQGNNLFGHTVFIDSIPENSNVTDPITFNLTVQGGNGDNMKVDIIKKPSTNYYLDLFFKTTLNGNKYLVKPEDRVFDLVFNATGDLIGDELFLITNAPDSEVNIRYTSNNDSEFNDWEIVFTNSCEVEKFPVKCILEGSDTEYNIYKITNLRSYVEGWYVKGLTSYSSSPLTDPFGWRGTLWLNNGITKEFQEYHGACMVTLELPCVTYKNIALGPNTVPITDPNPVPGQKYVNYGGIPYYVTDTEHAITGWPIIRKVEKRELHTDFDKLIPYDSSDYTIYPSNSRYSLKEVTETLGKYYYERNNSIVIKAPVEDDFYCYGYYGLLKVNIVWKEWRRTRNGWNIYNPITINPITISTSYVGDSYSSIQGYIGGMTGSKLDIYNPDGTVEKGVIIGQNIMYANGVNNTVLEATYGDVKLKTREDWTDDNAPILSGVLFEIEKDDFNNNYEFRSGDILTISSGNQRISFNIKIELYNNGR